MRSVVGPEELAALARVIERGYLAMGPEVKAFEDDLRAFFGGERHVVCVSTGTAALHLALQACGIGPGDEVLVPTFTYVATFQAISATGATPVACDSRPETAQLDVADAASRITARTKAIMPVHYAGGVGDLAAVYELADKQGLRVIEDAAQAFGSSYGGNLIGKRGDIVCFSFDGVKAITSGEGGAIVTADPKVAEHAMDARLLGVQKDSEQRYAQQRSWEFDVVEQGWRFHMSDLFAAIGQVQLRRFPEEFRPRRVQLAQRYVQLLRDVPGVRTLAFEYGPIVPWNFPVFVGEGKRDAVRAALLSEGIECGIHYKPNHLLTKYGGGNLSLPVSERLYEEVLVIPLHPLLTDAEQDFVAGTLIRAVNADNGNGATNQHGR
jgi:dTDP-4-amino-4,6-dideoxygalactose transaminase